MTDLPSGSTLKKMEKVFALVEFGTQLWTRELASSIRDQVERVLNTCDLREVLVLDAKGVDVFDYSFANELFGKLLFKMPNEFPGRFLIVEHLTGYTRENLAKALETLGLIILERKVKKLQLLGKVHTTDEQTFAAILAAKEPVTASMLKDVLKVNLTAMNERLTKFAGLSLVYREKATSSAGREQYVYWPPFL